MDRFVNGLDRVVKGLLAMMMAAASLAILAQVFFRYVMSAPISWAEEFAVLVFAWIIFLGAAYVQRNDSHLSIDSLRRLAGVRVRIALDLLRLGVIVLSAVVLIWQGVALALRTWPLLYPAMGVSRSLLYISAPVCFAVGLVYVAADLCRRWRNGGTKSDPVT
ncbi:MAG: TRAP transporter small permease [Tagaea sp.]|nr:TRAP transporter small permease [Tagaea sp.]